MLTQDELEIFIKGLIETNQMWKFYKTKEWLELREEVLRDNHYECSMCKAKGKITRATCVHHNQYVKKHPRLALSRYYYWNGKRYENLIALCDEHHNEVHDRFNGKKKKEFKNTEKW